MTIASFQNDRMTNKVPTMSEDPVVNDSKAASSVSTVEKPPRNLAMPIAVGVILLLVTLVVGYALLDRLTPSSNRGIVSAGVVQIAPRISGEVQQVHVSDDAVVQADDPAKVVFDAMPGCVFVGRVQSIAWGIDPGRSVQGGLVVNQPATRWFEPARRIPVRIELAGGMDAWPKKVRVAAR